MRRTLLAAALLALAGCATLHLPDVPLPGVGAPPPPPSPAGDLVFDPPADLPAPEGLRATSGQYRVIPLQWDPILSAKVAGYLIERSAHREGPFVPIVALPDRGHLAWVDGGETGNPLTDGETLFYRLRAFGHDRRVAAASSEIAVATTAPLPDPPQGLRAYSRQPRAVPLSWEPSPDPVVAGYTVERSPTPDGPFEVVAELEGRHISHWLDSGLGDLRVLYYRVCSRNPGGERGAPSPVLRAVTKPVPLPPVGLRVVEQRLGANVLSWEPNVERDLRSYRLLRLSDDGDPVVVSVVRPDQTRAEDAGVQAGEETRYAVIAVDQDGLESRPSEVVSVRSVGYELRAEAEPGAVRLRWDPRAEEGFARARVTRSHWLWQRRTLSSETGEIADRDVAPGRRYTYVVVLEKPDGTPAPSSQALEVEVPEKGTAFVEIQEPAPRIPPPDDVPR